MSRVASALLLLLLASTAGAQDAPEATDVTSADIQKFINALPRDAVSDRPIRVVEVTGDYRVGVYGVFRPQYSTGCPQRRPLPSTGDASCPGHRCPTGSLAGNLRAGGY